MDNLSKIQLAEHVSKTLSEDLTKSVGQSVSGAEDKIKDQIKKTLTDLNNRQLIVNNDSPDVQVDILWNKWSLKQKAKWYLTNKVFKWIAQETRDLHTVQDLNILELYANWSDAEEPFAEPSCYRSDMPEWANPSPKNIVVSDITIRPTQAVEFININIEINKD